MYRPEGWAGYKRTIYNAHNTSEEVFDAGADMMLRRLRMKGHHFTPTSSRGPGTLVFIPDEEDNG